MKSNYNFKYVSNVIVKNTCRCIVFQLLFLLYMNIVLADTVILKCTYLKEPSIHEDVIITKVEKDEKGPKSVQYYYWDGKRLVAEYSFRITYTDGSGCDLFIKMSDEKDRQKILHNLLTKGQTAGIKLYSGSELTLSCLTLGYAIEKGYQLFLGRIPDGDEAINLVINNQTKYISFKDIVFLRHDSKGNVVLKLINGISLTGMLGSPPYQHLEPIIKGITKNGEFNSLLFSKVQEINFEKVNRQIGSFPAVGNEKSAKAQPRAGVTESILASLSVFFEDGRRLEILNPQILERTNPGSVPARYSRTDRLEFTKSTTELGVTKIEGKQLSVSDISEVRYEKNSLKMCITLLILIDGTVAAFDGRNSFNRNGPSYILERLPEDFIRSKIGQASLCADFLGWQAGDTGKYHIQGKVGDGLFRTSAGDLFDCPRVEDKEVFIGIKCIKFNWGN